MKSTISIDRPGVARLLTALACAIAVAANGAAAQEPLLLRADRGGAALRLESRWQLVLPAPFDLSPVLMLDAGTAIVGDTLLTHTLVVTDGRATGRDSECGPEELWWIGTAGSRVAFDVEGRIYTCDLRSGGATAAGAVEGVPSRVGNGTAASVPVRTAAFSGPTRLLRVVPATGAVADTVPRHADPRVAALGGRRLPGGFAPIAASDTALFLGDPEAGVVFGFGGGGTVGWAVHIPGIARSPYTQAELDAFLADLPEQARGLGRVRAAEGRAYFRQNVFVASADGREVWLGIDEGDPRRYWLVRVTPDGGVWRAELPAHPIALAVEGDTLALATRPRSGAARLVLYRIVR